MPMRVTTPIHVTLLQQSIFVGKLLNYMCVSKISLKRVELVAVVWKGHV